MKHAANDEANNSFIRPHEAKPGLFSGRIQVADPAGSGSSSRIYYRAVGEVPFQWESQPGKPKNLAAAASDPIPAPLSPPPAMQSAQLACRPPREPPAGSLWLWLWSALGRGGRWGTGDGPKALKPFTRSSNRKRTSNYNGVSSSSSSSSSLLPAWDGFSLPSETNDGKRSTPADEAVGCVCQRWSFSRLLGFA